MAGSSTVEQAPYKSPIRVQLAAGPPHVTPQEAKAAIDALAAAHKEYFDRAGVDDGDVLTLGKYERCVNEVCKLLALAALG